MNTKTNERLGQTKLFIPGPTEVRPEILQACATPMYGHRSAECATLYASISAKLSQLLSTSDPVMLVTSSASGCMEACVRNLTNKRLLCIGGGAFADRFAVIARSLGKEIDLLEVPYGQAVRPEQVAAALESADYDCVTMVFNETSTGVVHPVVEVAALVKQNPERMMVLDAVSCMAAERIDFAGWQLDACLAGIQKAFACPPGMTVLAVSEAALARSEQVPNRGWYFDFQVLLKSHKKNQTISTPVLSLLPALDLQLDHILAEGIDARYQRHLAMAEAVRAWASDRYALFAEEGHRSVTVTSVSNTRKTDIGALNKALRERHGAVLANGYGKLKDQTFRIGHMGDLTLADITELLGWLDELI